MHPCLTYKTMLDCRNAAEKHTMNSHEKHIAYSMLLTLVGASVFRWGR